MAEYVERELVQKRTFTRWINLHLEKCNPPMEVQDLFRDIQDGRILMALLEELSGCKLLQGFKQSSHRIFRLNNIAKVLSFLEERNVKLVSIDAADVADGNSSIVLGLIWNIILFFQIKELTGNIKNQFPSSSSLSSIPTSSDSDTSHSSTPSEERRCSVAIRDQGKAIKTLLQWVQRRTRRFGVAANDFGKSWTSGLAFLAVIKSIDPSLVDMRRALLRTPRENLEEAFRTAHYSLGIPRLLEPEDVTINPPDEQVIMTYVSQFLEHFPGMDEDDVSHDVIERGTSKVNAHLNDSMARNGVKRTRETSSYVVKRDWVKPPPKIFISSVSEESDKKVAPPQPAPSTKPWASDDSSSSPADSSPSPSPADERLPSRSLDLTKDTPSSVSASTSCSNSPQPSYVDSVISSPDSWSEMPSEVGPLEKLPESCSDASLNETSLVCDPKDSIIFITSQSPDTELPLDTGKPLDDAMDSELFIDEGNFSLCSLDSLQAKTPLPSEEDDALTRDSSAQGGARDEVPELGAITNGSGVTSEETAQHETVKTSPEDLSEAGCESGYFPEDKDSSLSLVETASASFSSSKQTVNDENKSREQSQHREKADHLQSSNDTKTADAEITREPDRITDQITKVDEPAVAPGCSVSRNGIPLPESESDIRSEDALLTDMLDAQQDDIHYAENVDVESAEDSDSCDGEGSEHPAQEQEAEVEKGGEQLEGREAKQPEKLEEVQRGEKVEEVKGASENILDQEYGDKEVSGEMADGKVEGASETCDEMTTERTDSMSVEMTSDRDQERTSKVDSDSDTTDKMDVSSSAMVNDHKDKSPQSLEEKECALERKTEEELDSRESKAEDVFTRSDSLITSHLDGTESSSAYPTGQTQSTSEAEVMNGTECKTESPAEEEEGTESVCAERQTGDECEVKRESAGAGGEAEVGDSQGSVCEHVPDAEGSRLGKKEVDEEVDEMDESERAPVSVIPLDLVYYPHYDVPIAEVIEAFVEPDGADSHGQDEAGAGSRNLIGSGEDGGGEDYGSAQQELRLSLSMAPLQRAPVQDVLPGPESDSSDSDNENDQDRNHVQKPPETAKVLTQDMVSDGAAEGQDRCVSVERPGEGLAETSRVVGDPVPISAGGPGQSIKSDGEWTSARENTTAMREDVPVEENEPSTGPYLRATGKPTETETQSVDETSESSTSDKISLYSRRESQAETRRTPAELTLEEACLLLILWLIVYCLFVLPQIDFRTLPQLLFNIEE